jgi:hypothetical protein
LMVSGTQTTNLGTIIYKGIKQTYEGETKEYMIRLKEFYTGDAFKYIVFQHDNDDRDDRTFGISHISDISLHEMEPSCLAGASFDFTLDECTVTNFMGEVQEVMNTIEACGGKDVWREMLSLIDGHSDSDVRDRIEGICSTAYPKAIKYEKLLDKEKQFVEEFFDGGNKWNYEVDDEGGPNLGVDAARITMAADKFDATHAIAFPDVHNFEGCELRAAMCCYVAARNADYAPVDNSDACYMDFSQSRQSSHVRDGYSIYPGDSEGNLACHGFAWGNDSAAAAFKGNTLFEVALEHGLYTNKEVEELPGAPMCGCVEHMPVVSRADCTATQVTQTVEISYNAVNKQFSGEATITSVEHSDCGDLGTYYSGLVDMGLASEHEEKELAKHLVGDNGCDAALADFLGTKGFEYSA